MRAQLALALALAAVVPACRSTGGDGADSGPAVSFAGNEEQGEARLFDAIASELRELRRRPSKAAVDDAAYALEIWYRSQGYAEAAVDYEYDEPTEGDGRGAARLVVAEGARVRLAELEIEGNSAYDDDALSSFFDFPGDGGSNGERYFVEDVLERAARAIEVFYRESGYLRATVSASASKSADARAVSALMRVDEGALFALREVRFEGQAESALTEDELRALVRDSIGEPYTPSLSYRIAARIERVHAQRGYPDCTVTPETEVPDDGDVRVLLSIEPAELVTISEVRFEGNEHTKERFLRSRTSVKEGERYDAEKVAKSFRNLYKSGLFETVRIELLEDTGKDRTLVVQVDELPTRELYFEPGFGSYEGPRIELGARERNLGGTGKTLTLDTGLSGKAQTADLSLTDPRLFGESLDATASLFASNREFESFTRIEYGVGFGVLKRWRDRLESSLVYRFRQSDVEDVDVDDPDPLASENLDISSITLSTTWEDRDSFLWPREGGHARASFEVASREIGSEVNFLRFELGAARYVALGDRTVLALSLRTGAVAAFGLDDTVPLQERFFNGGENTVRSFHEDELGPKDMDGEPTGGEAFTVLSTELRRELAGNFSGALFLDAGNVQPFAQDYFEFDDVETGIGVGLRYLLPIGPLRLDAAANPSAGEGEDEYVIHFSVGMAF